MDALNKLVRNTGNINKPVAPKNKVLNTPTLIQRAKNAVSGSNNALKPSNNAPKPASNNAPKPASNNAPKASSNNAPKASNNTPKPESNNAPKASNNTPKPSNNAPKASNNAPKASNNAPKASSNNAPKASNNAPKAIGLLPSNENENKNKLQLILESTDIVSNIIKVCIGIVLILVIILLYNISLKFSGNFRQSIMFLVLAVLSFVMGEIVLEKLIGQNVFTKYISIGLFGVGTLMLLFSLMKAYEFLNKKNVESPMILEGTKSARKSMVIPQNNKNLILYRSDNQPHGIEFTYNFWMVIEDYGYKSSEWKHIMHKGNKEGTPNMCPGFYLHPNKNSMRVYINTMTQMKEYFDIDNLPLKKWVCVALVVKQQVAELYINGMLKKRHELTSIPRQNYGELWLNLFGGFDGFMSKVQYHRRALNHQDVLALLKSGPSSNSSCVDSDDKPPYLDEEWWVNSF